MSIVHGRKIFSPLVISCAIITGGCASSVEIEKEQREEEITAEVNLLEKYENLFSPAEYDPPLSALRRPAKIDTIATPEDTLKISEPHPVEMTPGFRIQVLSTTEIDEASTLKDSLLVLFETDSVYVVYNSPYYKVRVGDFLTRPQGNALLRRLIDLGYKDAWIVADRVLKNPSRKPIFPPQPKEPD